METREFWDVFGRCLSKLPQGLADAFFLRELDGLGAEEVQQILGHHPGEFLEAPPPRAHRSCGNASNPAGSASRRRRPAASPERSVPLMSRLKTIWRLLNLPCEGMTRLASESLDRDLAAWSGSPCGRTCSTASPAAAICARSSSCGAPCGGSPTHLETDEPLPGPGLPDDVRERIKRALKGELIALRD